MLIDVYAIESPLATQLVYVTTQPITVVSIPTQHSLNTFIGAAMEQ